MAFLGAVLLAGCAATPSPTIAPSPSPMVSPTTSPSSSLTAAFPSEVLGLPAVTVSDVLELAATDDRPGEVLAVKGWHTPPVALSCPSPMAPQALLQLGCGDSMSALTEYPERVLTIGPSGWSGHSPTLLAGRAQPTVADAGSYVETALPGATILSVAYLAGETVRRIEPLAGYEGDGALYVVRVIGPAPCSLAGDDPAWRHWSRPGFTFDGVRVSLSPCL